LDFPAAATAAPSKIRLADERICAMKQGTLSCKVSPDIMQTARHIPGASTGFSCAAAHLF